MLREKKEEAWDDDMELGGGEDEVLLLKSFSLDSSVLIVVLEELQSLLSSPIKVCRWNVLT